MMKVIFACIHNAGRSQMAAAFFNQMADPSKAQAISAGTAPAAHVHPEVVETMEELGLNLSNAVPQQLTESLASGAQWLITMGCAEQCPYVPGLRREDWALADPKALPIDEVRAIRDTIRRRAREFLLREKIQQRAEFQASAGAALQKT